MWTGHLPFLRLYFTPASDAFSSGNVCPFLRAERGGGTRSPRLPPGVTSCDIISIGGDEVQTVCHLGPELDYHRSDARYGHPLKNVKICIPAVGSVSRRGGGEGRPSVAQHPLLVMLKMQLHSQASFAAGRDRGGTRGYRVCTHTPFLPLSLSLSLTHTHTHTHTHIHTHTDAPLEDPSVHWHQEPVT